MFIETLKVRIKNGGSNSETESQIRRKRRQELLGPLRRDLRQHYDTGNITSINVKHSMFPDVEMVAFPRRDDDPVTK